MKFGLGCCLLVTLGLVSCGGTSGSATLSGDNPAAIKAAPAGVSTTVFVDLELIRPDNLTGASSNLPSGITASPALALVDQAASGPQFSPQVVIPNRTYTFTNVKAADGGLINGTIVVTPVSPYQETFNLTVTTGTPGQSWTYTGSQTVTVTGTTATVTVNATAAYADTNSPANNRTWLVTTSPQLNFDWTSPSDIKLGGAYKLASGPETITVTLSPSLAWNSTVTTCYYPFSGTMTLDLVNGTLTDSTTVVFSSTCGQVTIGGVTFNLGQ